MTKVNLTTPNLAVHKSPLPTLGSYWYDKRMNCVYILGRCYVNENLHYLLTCVATGIPYTDPNTDIREVFAGDESDFVEISNVSIKCSQD